MTVLTIAASKGGAGKTTVARALAARLAAEAVDFVVVDADPTEALSRWSGTIYEGPAFPHQAETDEVKLAKLIYTLAEKHPLVLVDTPGFANKAAAVAIGSADFVLIPTKASEPDLQEAVTTADKVHALALQGRRKIPARVICNGVRKTDVQAHALKQIQEAGLEILDASLGHRAAYETITHSGRTPTAGPAWKEITALVDELRALGWVPKKKGRAA